MIKSLKLSTYVVVESSDPIPVQIIFDPVASQNGWTAGEYEGRLSKIEPCSTVKRRVPSSIVRVDCVSGVLFDGMNFSTIVLYTLYSGRDLCFEIQILVLWTVVVVVVVVLETRKGKRGKICYL